MNDLTDFGQFHKTFFERSRFACFVLRADGAIAAVNPCCHERFTPADSGLIGVSFESLLLEDDKNLFLEALITLESGSDRSVELSLRLSGADGHTVFCCGELFRLDASPRGLIGAMFQDRTAWRQVELERLREQRIQAAGHVAGQIAHDLNNLLAPLTAYPALMREESSESETTSRLLDEMETAAAKITIINHQLLAFGRRTKYEPQLIDLNVLVEDTLFSLTLRPEIQVCLNFANKLPCVLGSAQQLSRTIANIIANADESMPQGGVISLTTKRISLGTALRGYQTVLPGNYVQLSIADQGHGIEEGIREKIFEPFFTTRRSNKNRGAGLGLSIACAVMVDHGGRISFESNPQGTCFDLYFPVAPNEVIAPTPRLIRGQNPLPASDAK